MRFRFFKNRTAIGVGIASAIFIVAVLALMGNLNGHEAKNLIEESVPKFNMLFNTITLACATILALLLTALGTSLAADSNIKNTHYKDILDLTSVVTITFVASLFSFQLLLVPITETEGIELGYYDVLYWIILSVSSILVGLTITIALMLRNVIMNIISIAGLNVDDHHLVQTEENEQED